MAPRRPAVMFVVSGAVLALAVGDASGRASAAPQAGGSTLRVITPLQLRTLDPGLARPVSYARLYATCATLMAFPDAAGAAGFQVRPEAAAAPPRISGDRRTYVFSVRRGLRFSDGSRLTAANFALALRRVLDPAMQSDGAFLFSDVRQVSASGRRLRIRLKKPSGDLATRLAMPLACPVPLRFPVDPAGVDLLIGSGPYYIARKDPNGMLVLERNPYYRGTRPHRVGRIVISYGGDLDSNINAVEAGQADVLGLEISRYDRDALAQRYGINKRQFFRIRGTNTDALVLNTSRPLFRGNVALRKAVNLAVDRGEVVRRAGASSLWFTPTDQIVPRWIPGWKDYHIYPLARPDLARARKLAAGNLRGGKATLYSSTGPGSLDQATVIVRNLHEIGLDVTVKPMDVEVINLKAGVPGEPYDMILAGFHPAGPSESYPDPAMMLVRLLGGPNTRGTSGNTNFAYFDNPSYNRRLSAADGLAGPARFRAFSRLDAAIMRNQAPWVPLFEGAGTLLLSKRVGCLRLHAVFRSDYAAMCVH